jgi:hypothetical protein
MTSVVRPLLCVLGIGVGLWGLPALWGQEKKTAAGAPVGKVTSAAGGVVGEKKSGSTTGPGAAPSSPPPAAGAGERPSPPGPRPAASPAASGTGNSGSSPAGGGELPPGSILVPYEMIKGKIQPLPFYWVPAPVYRQMEQRLRELERRLRWERSVQSCKLQGRLEGDVVALQAELKLYAEQPQSRIVLGFQGAVLSADAELDEQPPLLSYQAEEGYVVEVPRAGWHRLVLPLKVPLPPPRPEAGGGGLERTLEMGLPGAAVTTLVLELPASIKELRRQGQVLRPSRPGVWELALGTARQLQLSWRELPAPRGGPALSARWQVRVTMQSANCLTEAQLTLEDRRTRTGEWRLRLPPGALVRVLGADAGSYEVLPVGKEGQWLLKGPASEHLEVLCSWQQARAGRRLAVGPWQLLGAERQEGLIEVRAAAEALRGVRLAYFPAGFTQQQDLPRDSSDHDLLARFTYTEPPLERSSNSPRPPLEIELQPVVALVEAAAKHHLHLTPTQEGWQIQVQSTFRVWPVHNGLDQLELLLPQNQPLPFTVLGLSSLTTAPTLACPLPTLGLALAPELLWPVYAPTTCQCEQPTAARLEKGSGATPARLHLPQLEQQEFAVVLRTLYLAPADSNWARLELPRLRATLDRGAEVTFTVAEGYEVHPGSLPVSLSFPAVGKEATEPSASREAAGMAAGVAPLRFASMPPFLDLAWQPSRPRGPVQLLADVTLGPRRIQVREELHLSGGSDGKKPVLRQLHLRAPAAVTSLRLLQGGQFLDYAPQSGQARLAVQQEPLVLEYVLPLTRFRQTGRLPVPSGRKDKKETDIEDTLHIPIFWPQEAGLVQARVRVWCAPGCQVELPDQPLAGESWQDQGLEVVAGKESLPALVVAAEGNPPPLVLRWRPTPLVGPRDTFAERGLIQVVLREEEVQYRVRFLFRSLLARQLAIEFPMPLARLPTPPQIWLAGKQVSYQLHGGAENTVHLIFPSEISHSPALLDIRYTLPASMLEFPGRFAVRLHPPLLPKDVFVGRLRWQVQSPSGWLLIPLGNVLPAAPQWVWRQGLLTPESAVSAAELEAWLTGQEGGEAGNSPGLVLWATELEPVTCVRLPHLLWLGLCSGILLLLAIGLLVLAPARRGVFLLLGLLLLGGLATGLFWPAGLPLLVYGCEPGGVVLVLMLLLTWGLTQRYQRQLVFLPSFSRARSSGALSRGSGSRKGRETSTVDAPQLRGSSGLVQGSGSSCTP